MASRLSVYLMLPLVLGTSVLFAQTDFDFRPFLDTLIMFKSVNDGPTGYSGLHTPESRAVDSLTLHATKQYISDLLEHDAPSVRAAAIIATQRSFPELLWENVTHILADTSIIWYCAGCSCDERMLADLGWKQMIWEFGNNDLQSNTPCQPDFKKGVQYQIDEYLVSGVALAGYESLDRLACLEPPNFDYGKNFIETGSVYALNEWLQRDTAASHTAVQFLTDHVNSSNLSFMLDRLYEGWSPELWAPLENRIAGAMSDPVKYSNEQLLSSAVYLLSGQQPTPEARAFGLRLAKVLPEYKLRIVERNWGIETSDW